MQDSAVEIPGSLHVASIAAVLLVAVLSAAGSSAVEFDVQGHRGARGLRPENTLPAFAEALCVGVTTVELDVGVSRDGVVVVRHGRGLHHQITRRPGGKFLRRERVLIAETSFQELRRLDVGRVQPGSRYAKNFPEVVPVDGTRIPTLAEVIALVDPARTGVRLNIETKLDPLKPDETLAPDAFADAVIAVIVDRGAVPYATLQSFDWRTLARARVIAPEIPRVHLTDGQGASGTVQRGIAGASPWLAGHDVDDYDGSVPRLVAALEGIAWSPPDRDLDRESLAEAHALGLRVVPWTVNEPDDMKRLLGWGVDGIITDYPNRLNAVLRDLGRVPPAAVAVKGAAGRSPVCPPGAVAAAGAAPSKSD